MPGAVLAFNSGWGVVIHRACTWYLSCCKRFVNALCNPGATFVFKSTFRPMPETNPSEPSFLPEQERSVSKDIFHEYRAATLDDAEEDFLDAKDRLLHVNDWHELTQPSLARFALCDAQGHPVQRSAHIGDFIRISITGPAHPASDSDTDETGDDWVRIEALAYDDYPDEDRERIALQVRPAASPLAPSVIPQHFFSAEATSTFAVERTGQRLAAAYWGRNEVPNVAAGGMLDSLRNAAVAIGGILGFSDIQWKALVRGLLQPPDVEEEH